jgi:hypothetical protein
VTAIPAEFFLFVLFFDFRRFQGLRKGQRHTPLHAQHAPQGLHLRHALDHDIQEEAARLQPVGQ